MARADLLHVEVVYCPQPGQADRVRLELDPGATLADALRRSGVVERHGLDWNALRAGIWSKLRDPATVLRDHDRVEIYRPLTVDPKEARRQRYKRQKTA